MIRHAFRAAFLALCFALTLTGCTSGDRPVAKVGDRLITSAEFLRRVQGNEMQYPLAGEQARAAALEDIMKGEMLVLAARARGADTTTAYRNMERQATEQALATAITEQLAPATVGVSEGEARELWRWSQTKADVQLIYLVDEPAARAARAQLDAGRPFAEVAERFGVRGVMPNEGRLGFVTPGSLISPLDQAMLSQKIGEAGGPYETPQGWFFVLVNAREKNEVQLFEPQVSTLMERIRGRKRMMARNAGLLRIEHEYRGRILPGAPQLMFRYFTQFRVSDAAPWTPNAAERAQVVARWDGGQLTFGDLITELQNPEMTKPASSMLPAIEAWIRGIMRTRIVLGEARRRHLLDEPAMKQRIRSQLDQYLAQGEYAAAIQAVSQPSMADVKSAWDAMKANYEQLDRAHVQYVVADSATAAAIGMHGGHAGSLADAVRMAAPALTVRDETIVFPTQDPEKMALQNRLLRMAPGDWMGPEPVAGGWRLLQLQDKVQGPREFEQLPPEIVQSVASNAWEMARNRRLELYLDSLRTSFKPTAVPENLARVAWPPANRAGGMPNPAGMMGR
ncbi:MAG: peptidylprolyl isomerase [Candidatus Eisenbacteria bacterium]